MENEIFKFDDKKPIITVALLLILLTFLTSYYGSTDTGDYSNTAKFFAGDYSAKIRSSHSYLFGFIHSFLLFADSFIIFKITSIIFLLLIIYSVYIINNRDKKTLWLMLLSPIVWYMAPWIAPIQLAGLFLLWAFYFINKYDRTKKITYLLYSGIFVGLGWAVWDTVLFFGVFLMGCFLYNRKVSHLLYFILAVFIGLSPRLLLDQFLFNFPFFTILKSTFGTFANIFGGIYGYGPLERASAYSLGLLTIIPVLLAVPLYYWGLYKKRFFKNNKKAMIFLSLSLLLIFINPQIRYLMVLVPIMILLIGKNINKKQFKRQIIFSIIIILLFIFPYILQISYSIDNQNIAEFSYLFRNSFKFKLGEEFNSKIIRNDLEKIIEKYPNETFVVGNEPDTYQAIARLYWGGEVEEFVSIQDYELAIKNESILYEKTFMPIPNIKERRQIWISGGLSKNENDDTDYENISLGIGIGEPIELEGFKRIKRYDILYLSRKSHFT